MIPYFNTAGPIRPDLHYYLPPLSRIDLAHLLQLIEQQKYFVLHAPRQTGKTSMLLALMDYLNQQGGYRCLYVNMEIAQAARERVEQAMPAIVQAIGLRAATAFNAPHFEDLAQEISHQTAPAVMVEQYLTKWAQRSDRPLVLLIDEIDALVGDTLIAMLRQLRSGYTHRPRDFPQTIILCGVRDVRDYHIHSAESKEIITGGSAFNIKAISLRLGNFSPKEVQQLYQQHEAKTGQVFTAEALTLAWELTRGQPWLVNALAYEATVQQPDVSQPLTAELLLKVKEILIARRETHLDQLADKLREPRVRRVIEPILAGHDQTHHLPNDDILYVQDLGLIEAVGQLRIANPIYQEVIPRELTFSTQVTLPQETVWYVQADGRLDMAKLLSAFQEFFRQNSEHWLQRFEYQEAGPQLLMQAFLQRVINGGGRVEREYGLGRLRTDLLVMWPYGGGQVQRVVLELKLLHQNITQTLAAALPQTWAYMDRCGTREGHLLIFDRRPKRAWRYKIFRREETYQGLPITVWGM